MKLLPEWLRRMINAVISRVTPEGSKPIVADPNVVAPQKGVNPDQLTMEKETRPTHTATIKTKFKVFQKKAPHAMGPQAGSTGVIFEHIRRDSYQPGFHKTPKDPTYRNIDKRKGSRPGMMRRNSK